MTLLDYAVAAAILFSLWISIYAGLRYGLVPWYVARHSRDLGRRKQ